MKGLLKILLGGFVVFMGLSISQEWEFFSSAWFGEPEPRAPLTDDERNAAAEAVHMTLSLMRHVYLSSGDPRFGERMPAAEGIVEEILADVRYLARNQRVQDPEHGDDRTHGHRRAVPFPAQLVDGETAHNLQ